jgi:glycyl-tRNA synthetase beta chain
MTPRDLLLELLFEPLPGALVPAAAARLAELAGEELSRSGLTCAQAEVYGTCRRLALYVPGVQAGAAAKALPAALARALERLDLPGSRSWDASGFRFPRPVRGLLALHGERLVSFSAAGLKSGRVTEGHEAAGPKRVTLASAEKYFKALEHASVLVKDGERLAAMKAALDAASRRMKLGIELHEETLREALYSCEYPSPVISGFCHDFLRLPPERLRAALRSLLFFPVSDDNGRLQPYFAAFRDGVSRGQRNVEDGYRAALESVLASTANH